MRQVTRDILQKAISPLVRAEAIASLEAEGGRVRLVLSLPLDEARNAEPLRLACEQALLAVPGVTSAQAVLTAHSAPREGSAHNQPARPAQWNLTPLPGVKKIILVASGKGGVGKSTVAAGLAQALARVGKRVGLLDADIYGPSVPRLFGLKGARSDNMQPLTAHGVKCMSLEFLTGEQAAVLRGPMVTKALHQLLRATAWGELDTLFIDTPPGTGDVHLSLAQAAPMHGVVLVVTPQALALDDARKAAEMYQKLHLPILGVVENMSGEVFGRGGGKQLAEECGVPLLAEIPLEAGLRKAGDAGELLAHPAFNSYASSLS